MKQNIANGWIKYFAQKTLPTWKWERPPVADAWQIVKMNLVWMGHSTTETALIHCFLKKIPFVQPMT